MLTEGREIPNSPSLSFLLKKARNGDLESQFRVALAFEKGTDEINPDQKIALDWYTEAANKGHGYAQLQLAYQSKNLSDNPLAKKWAVTAYNNKKIPQELRADLAIQLARFYVESREDNVEIEIKKYYEFAFKYQSFPHPLLIDFYLKKGSKEEISALILKLTRIAEIKPNEKNRENIATAQNGLGRIYHPACLETTCPHVKKDAKKAEEWFRKAKENGDLLAASSLLFDEILDKSNPDALKELKNLSKKIVKLHGEKSVSIHKEAAKFAELVASQNATITEGRAARNLGVITEIFSKMEIPDELKKTVVDLAHTFELQLLQNLEKYYKRILEFQKKLKDTKNRCEQQKFCYFIAIDHRNLTRRYKKCGDSYVMVHELHEAQWKFWLTQGDQYGPMDAVSRLRSKSGTTLGALVKELRDEMKTPSGSSASCANSSSSSLSSSSSTLMGSSRSRRLHAGKKTDSFTFTPS